MPDPQNAQQSQDQVAKTYDTSQLDEIQHPVLGTLKFPHEMPADERNQIIQQQLQARQKSATPAVTVPASGQQPTMRISPPVTKIDPKNFSTAIKAEQENPPIKKILGPIENYTQEGRKEHPILATIGDFAKKAGDYYNIVSTMSGLLGGPGEGIAGAGGLGEAANATKAKVAPSLFEKPVEGATPIQAAAESTPVATASEAAKVEAPKPVSNPVVKRAPAVRGVPIPTQAVPEGAPVAGFVQAGNQIEGSGLEHIPVQAPETANQAPSIHSATASAGPYKVVIDPTTGVVSKVPGYSDVDPKTGELTFTPRAEGGSNGGSNGGNGATSIGDNGADEFQNSDMDRTPGISSGVESLATRGLNRSLRATASDLVAGNPGRGIIKSTQTRPFSTWNFFNGGAFKTLQGEVAEAIPKTQENLDNLFTEFDKQASKPGNRIAVQVQSVVDNVFSKYKSQVADSTLPLDQQRKVLNALNELQESIENKGSLPEYRETAEDFRTKGLADLSHDANRNVGPMVDVIAKETEKAGRTPREFAANQTGLSPVREAHQLWTNLADELGKKANIDLNNTTPESILDRAKIELMNRVRQVLTDRLPGYKPLAQNLQDLKVASRVLSTKVRGIDVGANQAGQMSRAGTLGTTLSNEAVKSDSWPMQLVDFARDRMRSPRVTVPLGKLAQSFSSDIKPGDIGIPRAVPELGPVSNLAAPAEVVDFHIKELWKRIGPQIDVQGPGSYELMSKSVTPEVINRKAIQILSAAKDPIEARRQIQNLQTDAAQLRALLNMRAGNARYKFTGGRVVPQE